MPNSNVSMCQVSENAFFGRSVAKLLEDLGALKRDEGRNMWVLHYPNGVVREDESKSYLLYELFLEMDQRVLTESLMVEGFSETESKQRVAQAGTLYAAVSQAHSNLAQVFFHQCLGRYGEDNQENLHQMVCGAEQFLNAAHKLGIFQREGPSKDFEGFSAESRRRQQAEVRSDVEEIREKLLSLADLVDKDGWASSSAQMIAWGMLGAIWTWDRVFNPGQAVEDVG